jgi:hypothetical protein
MWRTPRGDELWSANGADGGTWKIGDISLPDEDGGLLLLSPENRVIFAANDGTRGSELWVTDGHGKASSCAISVTVYVRRSIDLR